MSKPAAILDENHADEPLIDDPKFWSKNSFIQMGYGLWVNQPSIIVGLSIGFSAVTVPQLKSPDTIFVPTKSEIGWIVSVLILAALFGSNISGFLMDRLGRRPVLIISLIPMVIGWTYTGYANTARHMIVGRTITGIGVGMFSGPSRTYCTEISLPNMRAVIGAFVTSSVSMGITIEGLLGKAFKWKTLCLISSVYSSLIMISNFFLPETPYFVLMSGDITKTRKALMRIRAKNYNVDKELHSMQLFSERNEIQKLPIKKIVHCLFQSYACKPFSIILIYIIISQISGISIMMFWTVEILKDSKLSFDPYTGNIILATTRLIAGLCTSLLVFWVPRRPIAISSALVVGIICVGLGLFVYYTVKPTIVPIIGFMMYMIAASMGYYSMPLLMLFELLPLQIRGFLGGFTVSMVFVSMFVTNKVFPYVRDAIGFPFTIVAFGICSLTGCIFLYYFLPETKGLTLQEIEEFYRGRRPTLERTSVDEGSEPKKETINKSESK